MEGSTVKCMGKLLGGCDAHDMVPLDRPDTLAYLEQERQLAPEPIEPGPSCAGRKVTWDVNHDRKEPRDEVLYLLYPRNHESSHKGKSRARRKIRATSASFEAECLASSPTSLQSIIDASRSPYDIKGVCVTSDITGRNRYDIRIMYLNANGLRKPDLDVIFCQMMARSIDIVVCTDARVGVHKAQYYGRYARAILGPGSRTFCSTKDETLWSTVSSGLEPGGQFFIIGSKYGPGIRDFEGDRSGFGLVTRLYVETGLDRLLVLGNNWPVIQTEGASPGSLYQRRETLSTNLREFAQMIAQQ